MSAKKRNGLIEKNYSREMKEFWSDISEMSIDKTLEFLAKEQELLREIPIIKWVSSSINIKNSIQSAAFIRKYSVFIGQIYIEELGESEINLLDNAVDIPEVTDKIVDNTILFLDRYHNDFKAKLLGRLFVETFKFNRFSVREYNCLLFSIEQIHPFEGLEKLKEFYNYKIMMDEAMTDEEKRKIWSDGAQIDFQPLATSGLLKLPSGGSYVGDLGGAFINEIGIKFYEFVVSKLTE